MRKFINLILIIAAVVFMSCEFGNGGVTVPLLENPGPAIEESDKTNDENSKPEDETSDESNSDKENSKDNTETDNTESESDNDGKKESSENDEENKGTASENDSKETENFDDNANLDSSETKTSQDTDENSSSENDNQNDINKNDNSSVLENSENINNTENTEDSQTSDGLGNTENEETGENGNEENIPGINREEEESFRRKWTFIVYMASDNGFEANAIQDINEMEAGISDDKTISVLALFDRHPGFDGTNGNWSDTRLYEIQKDSGGKNGTIVSKRIACSELDLFTGSETELDMCSQNTLSQVIDFAKREYEADNYVLVMWGHGYGWRGYGMDGTSDTKLSLVEFNKAVENKGLHTIIFDTSFGLTVETLYELRDDCSYVAGTGGINLNTGLDYEKLFKKFFESDRGYNSLFNAIVNFSGTDFLIFDTDESESLCESVNNFGKALALYTDSRTKQKKLLEDCMVNIKTYSGSTYPTDCFIDLYSMALYLQRYQDEGIRSSSEKLMSVLEKSCSAGKVPDVSAHLIPLLGKKVTASSHDEAYVKDDSSLLNNGFEVCDFVKDGEYWVPTGKNKSFLDALFYRTF